jgi:CelD/BcsL family acetyltransferase involved in cellulose biosynthesis
VRRSPPRGGCDADTPRFQICFFSNLAELEQLWLDLEQRAAPGFFLSWDWIGCWIREASLRPAVLIGQIDGRVVLLGALMPSVRRRPLPLAIHGLRLHMTGERAIAFLLSGDHGVTGLRCDELHLKNVPAEFRQSVSLHGIGLREVQRKPSWRVDLAAIRAEDRQYLECLNANARQQIRRAIRLYDREGWLTALRARDVPQALSFLDGLRELHQSHWTARGHPGGFAYPFFAGFQKRLIETGLPHGTVEIFRISAGSNLIGYVYNLVYRGHVYAYQTGLRYQDDPRLKPGLVSHCLCIDRHLADGSNAYDFMAGDARYKASLGTRGPDMLYLLAQRPTWPLRLEGTLYGAKCWLESAVRWVRTVN